MGFRGGSLHVVGRVAGDACLGIASAIEGDSDERPQHNVAIKTALAVSRTEITRGD